MRKSGHHIHYLAACICSLALSACEVEFDFSGLDGDPLFLLDGQIKTGAMESPGTGNLQMYLYAVPPAAGQREFSSEARCTLKVYRNSELIDTKDYITIEDFYGLIADRYDVIPGDRITVTAESAGFPTASATTVILPSPPEVEASYCMKGKDLKIRLSFTDNAETDDAYAFCFRGVISENGSLPDESTYGTSFDLAFGDTPESSFLDIGPFDVSWEDGYRYYGISDETFNGCRKELEVTVPGFGNAIYAGEAYFRIEINSVSPERLRYEKACIDKATNGLGFIGLAPVTFAYTNVSGGSGCIGNQNARLTPWILISRGE